MLFLTEFNIIFKDDDDIIQYSNNLSGYRRNFLKITYDICKSYLNLC